MPTDTLAILLQATDRPAPDTSTFRIVCVVLIVVLVAIIILRRRSKKAKKDEEDF